MQWEIEILPQTDQRDHWAEEVTRQAKELGIVEEPLVTTARVYLLDGECTEEQIELVAGELLADPVVQRIQIRLLNGDGGFGCFRDRAARSIADNAAETRRAAGGRVRGRTSPNGDTPEANDRAGSSRFLYVALKRGVTDPVASTAERAIQRMGIDVRRVRTLRKYWVDNISDAQLERLCAKVLANDSIEQVIIGPLHKDDGMDAVGYDFKLMSVPLRDLDNAALLKLSREGHLYLSLEEMKTIQTYFESLQREPTDAELETIAQTWSEHCSHKTLRGQIEYEDEYGKRKFGNLLKETIFAATQSIRESLGADDWCVSVFEDNAGVVMFDETDHIVFKVETHNHPSAIEPYGGANTGLGGVIRDPMGTGLGARPICNTDVFCFAPLNTPPDRIPEGVLHPRRVFLGVVAGVRDYGNRMGIPTVNGAVYFDERYLANPLVYCGNVGLLPVDKVHKQPQRGDWVVVVGGRTGRDGIHGATFSSAELTSESEELSGGAVQIGNAITEKMMLDVLLAARDQGLYHAVTDCGAGGLSSAVGEMGSSLGADVSLEKVPLKYAGLSYTEIWISEAQERMVLAVPPEKWPAFHRLCAAEDVEATAIGHFTGDGRLRLTYAGQLVADLDMHFLHDGRPHIVRQARYLAPQAAPRSAAAPSWSAPADGCLDGILIDILRSPNVASKEWIVRQYDHEVQGGSVLKPMVGAQNDGPGDAAVLRPKFDSWRGIAIACGMNPRYGDSDTYHMAASAIDEAVRNCVAVGADPSRVAILDNFCWGNTERPETLGSLVRAAIACHEIAMELGTPFISGKDSLNNEFSYETSHGQRTISIPPSLLISAIGQVPDVRHAVSMDLKEPGNLLFLVGTTFAELRGSHFEFVTGDAWGTVPSVHAPCARATFMALHCAMKRLLIRSCHDLSEGGLAAALAEMAFAGNLGAEVALSPVPYSVSTEWPLVPTLLFSESNSRFVCEVLPQNADAFDKIMAQFEVPHARIGRVTSHPRLRIRDVSSQKFVIDSSCDDLKRHWQSTLNDTTLYGHQELQDA